MVAVSIATPPTIDQSKLMGEEEVALLPVTAVPMGDAPIKLCARFCHWYNARIRCTHR